MFPNTSCKFSDLDATTLIAVISNPSGFAAIKVPIVLIPPPIAENAVPAPLAIALKALIAFCLLV